MSRVAGREVENEDLVNAPNWLPPTFRIDDGPWFGSEAGHLLGYRPRLLRWSRHPRRSEAYGGHLALGAAGVGVGVLGGESIDRRFREVERGEHRAGRNVSG